MLRSPPGRALLLGGLLALALAACGRKGSLEAPPDPAALRPPSQGQRSAGNRGPSPDGPPTQGRGSAAEAQASQATANRTQIGATPSADDDDGEGENSLLPGFLTQPAQTSSPQRRRPYKVPKEPFILDPLL